MNAILKQIRPSLGAKYSPNLYRWLKQRPHWSEVDVFQTTADTLILGPKGTLIIGFVDVRDFWGNQLMHVLCEGVKAGSWCYLGAASHVEKIEGFWDRYITDGRCAIDPEHQVTFLNDDTRWQVRGNTRSCLWCGKATQVLNRWTQTIEHERWETTTSASAEASADESAGI